LGKKFYPFIDYAESCAGDFGQLRTHGRVNFRTPRNQRNVDVEELDVKISLNLVQGGDSLTRGGRADSLKVCME
jgi:hypothetical protein